MTREQLDTTCLRKRGCNSTYQQRMMTVTRRMRKTLKRIPSVLASLEDIEELSNADDSEREVNAGLLAILTALTDLESAVHCQHTHRRIAQHARRLEEAIQSASNWLPERWLDAWFELTMAQQLMQNIQRNENCGAVDQSWRDITPRYPGG
ncbi:MAG: hypothetical protein ACE5PO_04240 [Candidatus Bathyarchaeia archaeon]